MKNAPRTAAFTLVELLVVIAIIALLMSLTLPGIQRAMETGRETACAAHIRQIAMAARSWSSERNEIIIPNSLEADQLREVGAAQFFWDWELMSYQGLIDRSAPYLAATSPMRNRRPPSIFACPSSRYLVHGVSPANPGGGERATTDFGKNFHTSQGRTWGGQSSLNIVTYDAVLSPSQVLLAADGWGADVANAGWHFEDMGVEFRHRDGTSANVVFLDGHVEPRTFAQLKSRPLDVYPWRDRAP